MFFQPIIEKILLSSSKIARKNLLINLKRDFYSLLLSAVQKPIPKFGDPVNGIELMMGVNEDVSIQKIKQLSLPPSILKLKQLANLAGLDAQDFRCFSG